MVRLDRVGENKSCVIHRLSGSEHLVRRLLSFGIFQGNRADVVRNRRFVPLLLRVGSSLVALGRREARTILVEER